MIIEVQVISERTNSYQGKRGKVEEQILACLDITPEHAFINTFDYALSEDEEAKHTGKLIGSRLRLAVHDMRPEFGGRLRFKGSILKVNA
jgi:hypothetical protein